MKIYNTAWYQGLYKRWNANKELSVKCIRPTQNFFEESGPYGVTSIEKERERERERESNPSREIIQRYLVFLHPLRRRCWGTREDKQSTLLSHPNDISPAKQTVSLASCYALSNPCYCLVNSWESARICL